MTGWPDLARFILGRRAGGDPADECAIHRPRLAELVDERALGGTQADDAATTAALDHLWACAECQHEIADLLLVVAGLQRLGGTVNRLEPPPGGWRRLSRRLAAPRPRGALRLRVAGLVVVPILAALLVAPALVRDLGTSAAGAVDAATRDAATVAVPVAVTHAAALQRAFDIGDGAQADPAAQAVEVVPRGPLPDGIEPDGSAFLPGVAVPPMPAVIPQ